MPTPERVQLYKSESTAAGGTDAEAAPYPVLIKPQTEAVDSAGMYVQDVSNYDYNVYIDRSGNDLRFTDTSTGTVALQNLSTLLLNHKRAVAVASVGSNIALTGTYSLDGYTINVGDRVLAKDQTTGADNGIYIASAGAWTRATDMDTSAKALPGLQTLVLNGTVNVGTTWRMTNTTAPTLGSTALTFAAFPGATYSAGSGLTLTGSAFSITTNGVADTMLRQSAGLSVIGRSANSLGNVADITGTTSRVLAVNNSNVLGFTTVTGAMTTNNTMTDTKLAQRGARSVMGNATNATANVADISATVTGPLRATATAVDWRKDNYAASAAPAVGDDNTQGYEVGSTWFDTTNDITYWCTDATTGAALWTSTNNGPVPFVVVGNALEGDTLRTCHYLDPGDGTGIAAALAAGGTAKTVIVRRGTYTLAATQSLLTVPAGWTVRGEGAKATVIKPRIGNAATLPWMCFDLSGDGAGIADIGFSIRDRAATIPAVSAPLGVISLSAKNTWIKNVYADIPGAFAATTEAFCVASFASSANYGGQVLVDITLNMSGATVTGDGANPYAVAAVCMGALTATTNVVATLPTTVAEPVLNRIRVTGGQCNDAASPAYSTYGVMASGLSQFSMDRCDFRGVYGGVLALWQTAASSVVTRGPSITNMTVENASGAAAFLVGGATLIIQETGAGTLSMSRIHIDNLRNDSAATGTYLPGVIVSCSATLVRDIRVNNMSARQVSAASAGAYCSVGNAHATGVVQDVNITDCTLTPSGSDYGQIYVNAGFTGAIKDLYVDGNKVDYLTVTGSPISKAILTNNRVRNAAGYIDTGTSTSGFNNRIG